jgi:hypothetical protein
VVNEASGIFVADCDKPSPEAEQWRERLSGITRLHQTSQPHKWHAFLRRPPGVIIAKKSTTLLGLNTECGQVLLPPSRHRNGSRYAVVSALPIAEPPAGLLDFLQSLSLETKDKITRKPRSKFKLDSGGLKVKITDPLAENALRALNAAKTAPPDTPEERQKLELALWYMAPDGTWIIDPRVPAFDAVWGIVLYALADLLRHGWNPAWVEALFIDWSKEALGLKNDEGEDIYPGPEYCAERLRKAAAGGRDNPRTVATIYELVRSHGWRPPEEGNGAAATSNKQSEPVFPKVEGVAKEAPSMAASNGDARDREECADGAPFEDPGPTCADAPIDDDDELTQRQKLILIGIGADLWHDKDNTFATVRGVESYPIDSTGFGRWLTHEYGERHPFYVNGKKCPSAPGGQALKEALGALAAKAATAQSIRRQSGSPAMATLFTSILAATIGAWSRLRPPDGSLFQKRRSASSARVALAHCPYRRVAEVSTSCKSF